MKVLIITAHPAENSFTSKIANKYKKASEKKNNDVEIIDLYDKEIFQEYLTFDNVKNIKVTNETKHIQSKIKDAKELVFIFPIWWADSPAIMKNFFDTNFSSGFAFKYDKTGKSIGLLKGKSAKVFVTCDGPGFFYKFPFVSLKTSWKYARLGFCGVKLEKFVIFDKMRKRSEEQREQILMKIENYI